MIHPIKAHIFKRTSGHGSFGAEGHCTSFQLHLSVLPVTGTAHGGEHTADSAGETCRVKLDQPLQTDYHTDLRIAEPAGQ